MTPAERDAEVASIFALGLARAIHADRSRCTRKASDLVKSDATRLELPQHADLSVSARPRGYGSGPCDEEPPCLMRSNDNSASFSG